MNQSSLMNMNRLLVLASLSLFCGLLPLSADDTLVAQPPVEITGTQGKFDFIKIDADQRRLLACHTGNGSLDVIDIDSSKLIKSIPTGAAQGVAIDEKGGRYFVSTSKPPKLVVIDSTKLEVTGEVSLPDPADILAYHAPSGRVYVCNDEKPEIWVIDPVAKQILETLTMPGGGMEDLGFDSKGTYLFQALKDVSQIARIEVATGKVVTTWPTAPVDKPHGIAVVPGADSILVVGGNGKLILMGTTTGQVHASADVAQRVDEIAYDPGVQRVYCASGTGTISVVGLDQNKLTTLAPLASSAGAHSIAVDPRTHAVWIAFAKDTKAYVQAFTLTKNVSSSVKSNSSTPSKAPPVIVSKSKTPTLRSGNISFDASTGKLNGTVYLTRGYQTPRLPHVHVYGLGPDGKVLFSGCALVSDEALHPQPRFNLNPRNKFTLLLPTQYAFSEIKVVTDSQDRCGNHPE